MRRAAVTLLTVATVGLAAGCGGNGGVSDAAAVAHPSPTPAAHTSDALAGTVTTPVGQRPTVDLPPQLPPALTTDRLLSYDVVTGDGPTAGAGATVTLQYLLLGYPGGVQLDSTWDRGGPATYPLSRLVPGVADGITGMKVGGRRILVIPPRLGYGDDPPAGISAGQRLVAVVDLVGLRPDRS